MEEVGHKYIKEVKQTAIYSLFCEIFLIFVSLIDGSHVLPTVPVIVPVAQYTQRNPSANSAKGRTPRPEFYCMKKETPSYPPGKQKQTKQNMYLSSWHDICV